jgi:hypothetical protein
MAINPSDSVTPKPALIQEMKHIVVKRDVDGRECFEIREHLAPIFERSTSKFPDDEGMR